MYFLKFCSNFHFNGTVVKTILKLRDRYGDWLK